MGMDVKPIVYSPSRADKKWANFIDDVQAIRAGTYSRNYNNGKTEEEIPQSYLDQHLKPKQVQLVARYIDAGNVIPGNTPAEQFQHLIALKPFRTKNGQMITMRTDDVEEYYEHSAIVRANYRYLKQREMVAETKPFPMDTDLSEFLELHGCKSFDTAKSESHQRKILLYTDLAYGSLEGDFAGFQDNDGYRILESLGFVSAEDFANREKWLQLYNAMTKEQWETAAQTIADEYSIDIPEAKDFIEDILIAIKPMIKELKQQTDATILMEINGELVLSQALTKTLEQRADTHYAKYKSVFKTK